LMGLLLVWSVELLQLVIKLDGKTYAARHVL